MTTDFTEDIAAMEQATTLEEKNAATISMNEKVYAEWAEKAPAFFERIEKKARELITESTLMEYMTVEYVIEGMKRKRNLGTYDAYILANLLHTSPWWILTGEEDPNELKIIHCSQRRQADLEE